MKNYEIEALKELHILLSETIDEISTQKERKFFNPIKTFQSDLSKVRKNLENTDNSKKFLKALAKLKTVLNTKYDEENQKIAHFKESLHLAYFYTQVMCDDLLSDESVERDIVEVRKIFKDAADDEVNAIEKALNKLEKDLLNQKTKLDNHDLIHFPKEIDNVGKKLVKLKEQKKSLAYISTHAEKFSHYVIKKVYGECALDFGYSRCQDHPHLEKHQIAVNVADETARSKAKHDLKSVDKQITELKSKRDYMYNRLNTVQDEEIMQLEEMRFIIKSKLKAIASIKSVQREQDISIETKTPWPFSIQQIKNPNLILSTLRQFQRKEVAEVLKACNHLSAAYNEMKFLSMILYARHLKEEKKFSDALRIYQLVIKEGSAYPDVVKNAENDLDFLYVQKKPMAANNRASTGIEETSIVEPKIRRKISFSSKSRRSQEKGKTMNPSLIQFPASFISSRSNKSEELERYLDEDYYQEGIDSLIEEFNDGELPPENNIIENKIISVENKALKQQKYDNAESTHVSGNFNSLFAPTTERVAPAQVTNNKKGFNEIDEILAQLSQLHA